MPHVLRFTSHAAGAYQQLQNGGAATQAKFKKVRKTLGLLQVNPRHSGLRSHEYENFPGHADDKVRDSYVENNTPSAWRIYWMYGPDEQDAEGSAIAVITVLQISPHM